MSRQIYRFVMAETECDGFIIQPERFSEYD